MPRLNQLEKGVQHDIKGYLELEGFFVSNFSQARPSKQTPGIPDLYAVHRKWRFRLWIEVKRPGETTTLLQRGWHLAAIEAGANVLVADSPEAVAEYLRAKGMPIRGYA